MPAPLALYLLSCAGVQGFINSSKGPGKKKAALESPLGAGKESKPWQEISHLPSSELFKQPVFALRLAHTHEAP